MGKRNLSIYFGTETGNSRWVAERIAQEASKMDICASVQDLVNVSADQLSRETDPCLIVISTWNRGQPPFFAKRFYAQLEEGKTRMEDLRFGVIAMGDRNYRHFCACGNNVDKMLEGLGGTRWLKKKELGADFRAEIDDYLKSLWTQFDKLS